MTNPKSPYLADYTVGDSIAHMLIEGGRANAVERVSDKEDKYSKVGIHPPEVLHRVKRLVKDSKGDLNGKHIVLSSGLSNTQDHKELYDKESNYEHSSSDFRQEFDNIEKQLQALKNSGAKVTLLGVSNENPVFTNHKSNDRLRALAEKYDATFVSLPRTYKDDGYLHPHSDTLFAAIKAADAEERGLTQMGPADVTQMKELITQINAKGRETYDLGAASKKPDGVNGMMAVEMESAIRAFEKQHGLASPDKETLINALKEAAGDTSQSSGSTVQPVQTPARAAAGGGRQSG